MVHNNSVYSGVVKDTPSSETVVYDENAHNSFIHTKVKSVVPFVSETIKTGNSCINDNVDTLKVVHNDSQVHKSLN